MRFPKLRIAWSVGLVLSYMLYPCTFGTHNSPPFWFTLERYWIGFVPVVAFAAIPWLPWHFSPRTLGIAWSVFWGLSCVLLIVLWVQSYWRFETVVVRSTYTFASFRIKQGDVICFFTDNPRPEVSWSWEFRSGHIDDIWPTRLSRINWFSSLNTLDVIVPLWFPSLVCGAIATIPCVRLSKRFTIRTLLIATTLVAVVLGLAVWAAVR